MQVEVGGVLYTVDPEAMMDAGLDLVCISVHCTADDLLLTRPGNGRPSLSDSGDRSCAP